MSYFDERINRVADAIRSGIAPMLCDASFFRTGDREWCREWGWKADVIDVIPTFRSVTVNFYVYVPARIIGQRSEYEQLALVSLSQLMSLDSLRLPIFRSDRWFIKNIVRGIREGLQWFEDYNSKRLAIDALELGPKLKSCKSYMDCHRYLMSLPDVLDVPACMLNESRWRKS